MIESTNPNDPQELEDFIADAIDDTMDMDWTGRVGAKGVIRALEAEGLVIVRVEAVTTMRQTLLEVGHAQRSGSGWYTQGASGLYQQVATHLKRAHDAVDPIMEPIDAKAIAALEGKAS